MKKSASFVCLSLIIIGLGLINQVHFSLAQDTTLFEVSGYILDTNGIGIADALIIFNDPETVLGVSTDSSGYYMISAPAGTYHISVWPPFDSNFRSYDQMGFVVDSDVTKNITLELGYKVSGYISDTRGIAVSGAGVSLNEYISGWYSNVSGYYFVTAPAGTYNLTVNPRSIYSHFSSYFEYPFTVNGDVTKNITVVYSPPSTLPGGSDSLSNWSMFQHDPEHTGYSTIEGPAFNAVQIWNYSSGGSINTSPAIVNGLVYLGSSYALDCIDEFTGWQVWTFPTESSVFSSPAVANGCVYFGCTHEYGDNGIGWKNGTLYCLNASTGGLVWSYSIGSTAGSSPVVVDGRVYIGSSVLRSRDIGYNIYSILCLDASTGNTIWNYSIQDNPDSVYFSSPAVSNDRVYVGCCDHNIYCFNASTGSIIWNYTAPNIIASSPAVANNYVYTSSTNDSVYCLNAITGKLVWNYSIPALASSSPSAANGRVYIGAGNELYCLDAFDGSKIWNYTGAWTFSTSPVVDGSRVYAGCYDGNVYCLDESTGTELWTYQTGGGPLRGSPALASGRIYVACFGSSFWFTDAKFPGTLYCLEEAPAIPEFPSLLIILPLFVALPLVVMIYNRKFTKR